MKTTRRKEERGEYAVVCSGGGGGSSGGSSGGAAETGQCGTYTIIAFLASSTESIHNSNWHPSSHYMLLLLECPSSYYSCTLIVVQGLLDCPLSIIR